LTVAEQTASLADVLIEIEVELGRRIMTIDQVLCLTAGSIVRLSRSAGDNIDILAGGHAFASGEIMIVEENFGVRITDFKEEN
jgi:flagellar motor switch protein FliN/FliY